MNWSGQSIQSDSKTEFRDQLQTFSSGSGRSFKDFSDLSIPEESRNFEPDMKLTTRHTERFTVGDLFSCKKVIKDDNSLKVGVHSYDGAQNRQTHQTSSDTEQGLET